MLERKTRKSHTWSLTMIPTRASLCNGKASFRDTAERLPRKEPHKAVGALFVDAECTSRPELASHQQNPSEAAPGWHRCPEQRVPSPWDTRHAAFRHVKYLSLMVSKLSRQGLHSAAAAEAKGSQAGCF